MANSMTSKQKKASINNFALKRITGAHAQLRNLSDYTFHLFVQEKDEELEKELAKLSVSLSKSIESLRVAMEQFKSFSDKKKGNW